jgi:capsular exopolysaccharide synthesis family protein
MYSEGQSERPNNFQEEEIDYEKILNLVLDNIWLFVCSVVLGLALSYAYMWHTEPVYSMSSTVLVEDEGNDISQSILDEVGVVGKSRNIENEIGILKSRRLMESAIERLGIKCDYRVDLGLRTRVIYKDSPLLLAFKPANQVSESFVLHVSVKDENSADITLEFINASGSEREIVAEVDLNTPFTNELGEFQLETTDLFKSMVLGDSALSQNYKLVHRSVEEIASSYLAILDVGEIRKKASILRLTIKDKVAQRGVDVLNAVLDVYIEENVAKKSQLASNSLNFIDNQLSIISKELAGIEAKIKSFKSNNNISNVSSESIFFLEQVGELDRSISKIDVTLSIINYLKNYVSEKNDLKNASPTSLGVEDPLLGQLIVKLSELTAERESMLRFTKEENPLISSIDIKIEETRASLIRNIESIKQGLLASKNEFESQLKKVEAKVSTLPKAEYELIGLQRQYSIKESLYLLLLEKKSDNSLMLASTVSDNLIVDDARSTKEPISPKSTMIYLIGLMFGLSIPSLYIFILLMFDDRLKSVDDLKKATSIPILGLIPHHESDVHLVLEGNANSPIAESFRSVRTNLGFLVRSTQDKIDKEANVIQLTSTEGSEGKSFCSVNLATSFALGGLKTIVVGLDLRKPKLAELFEVPNTVGCSSVLAGMESMDNAISKSGIKNLDILVGGPIPPNPSELLMSNGLAQLIKELRGRYDYVILDCPPIGLVTDGLIISEHVDTVIYLTRQGFTKSKGLAYINDLYATKKISSVSILFNDVKRTRFGYGTGFTYGYGYYTEDASTKTGFFQQFLQKIGK